MRIDARMTQPMNEPPDADSMCYACGPANAAGLHLRFAPQADGSVSTTFTPAAEHQGYRGIVHGGFIALVLDEAMVACVHHAGVHAVSSELTVRLLKPIAPGETLDVVATMNPGGDARVTARAEARRRADGTPVARATATCVRVAQARGEPTGHAPLLTGPRE
jgi:acyl-coenzyme A thioesterase PaaI-like protein